MLVNLKDGCINEIETDNYYDSGCDTCDYGSRYSNELTVKLNKFEIEVRVIQMYEYAISDDYIMKLMLHNLEHIQKCTEKEFCEWFEEKLTSDFDNVEVRIYDESI